MSILVPAAQSLFTVVHALPGSSVRTLVRDNTTQCLHVLSVRPLPSSVSPKDPRTSSFCHTLARVKHPSLIRYDDVYADDQTNTLVTVTEYFMRGHCSIGLTEEELKSALEALSALHAAGIPHGNIQIENMYVRGDGSAVLGPVNELAALEVFNTNNAEERMRIDVQNVLSLARADCGSPAFTVSAASHVTDDFEEEHENQVNGLNSPSVPRCSFEASVRAMSKSASISAAPSHYFSNLLMRSYSRQKSHTPRHAVVQPPPSTVASPRSEPGTILSPDSRGPASPTHDTVDGMNPFWYRGGPGISQGDPIEHSLYTKQMDEFKRKIEWEKKIGESRQRSGPVVVSVKKCCVVM
eukprot:PhF_6_TR5241/c0_g1_i2/m.7600